MVRDQAYKYSLDQLFILIINHWHDTIETVKFQKIKLVLELNLPAYFNDKFNVLDLYSAI